MINALVEHDLILGHAPFYKKNQWLNKVQRYDNTWIALQYMGLALRKSPYMGVGRNMAVTKSAYESMKHSIKGHHLKSGDDDLLVQALRFKSIGVQLDPQTFMYSNAESSYSSWLRQKKRQITTSTLYAVQHQVLLTLSAFLSMCTPILLLFNLLLCQDFNAFCLFVGYLIVLYSVKGRIFWKFKENDLIIILPILEILYSIHLLILSIFVLIKKSDAWK